MSNKHGKPWESVDCVVQNCVFIDTAASAMAAWCALRPTFRNNTCPGSSQAFAIFSRKDNEFAVVDFNQLRFQGTGFSVRRSILCSLTRSARSEILILNHWNVMTSFKLFHGDYT